MISSRDYFLSWYPHERKKNKYFVPIKYSSHDYSYLSNLSLCEGSCSQFLGDVFSFSESCSLSLKWKHPKPGGREGGIVPYHITLILYPVSITNFILVSMPLFPCSLPYFLPSSFPVPSFSSAAFSSKPVSGQEVRECSRVYAVPPSSALASGDDLPFCQSHEAPSHLGTFFAAPQTLSSLQCQNLLRNLSQMS